MLDGIFADCYARWAGRFSLLVPCVQGQIVADYWPWLEVFDPDIVYSYVRVCDSAVLEIHERLTPADYVFHASGEKAERLDVHGFRPRYNVSPLSSLSSIFRLARHSPVDNSPKIKVIDLWHTERPSRFLTDNFGLYRSSTGGAMFPNDARAAAGIMTIVSEEHSSDRRLGVPRDLDRVPDEKSAIAAFAAKGATAVSLLSCQFASRAEVRDVRWSRSFNLVIGDTFEDRLMFWNARLLIPRWLDSELCCLRLNREDLEQEGFAALLSQILNSRNHVTDGAGGQARVSVRSASHPVADLDEVVSILRKAKTWSLSGPVEVVPGGHVIPRQESLRQTREHAQAMDGRLRGSEWHEFRWNGPIARPPHLKPEHLGDAPSGQSFTLGLWAVDLSLEHRQDRPRFSQANVWTLSRRWRLAAAFRTKFDERGFGSSPVSINRASKHGNLTVFAGSDRTLESIEVPEVDGALQRALCDDSGIWVRQQGDPPWPTSKARWMWPSNERAHLTGILGMVGGLHNAARLLLHPFLRDQVFAALGGTTNLADADIRSTAEALAKRERRKAVFDLSSEDDRKALEGFIVKAAQSIKAPKLFLSLEELYRRWDAYREEYRTRQPTQGRTSSDDQLNNDDARDERALERCLAELRSRRMLFQGYPWTCGVCLHRNWTDFQCLRPSLGCDVCQSESELPIGVPWHFRPSEFLIESLRSHSVLSLVWVLSILYDRSRASFIYAGPTCFGYTKGYGNSEAEADLLAIVDGQTIVCEVKSAWRSLRGVDVDSLVELARRLRPDQAILAVMQGGESSKRLDEKILAARQTLSAEGIDFELLTLDKAPIHDAPFLLG